MKNDAELQAAIEKDALIAMLVHDLSTPLTIMDVMLRKLDPGLPATEEDRLKFHRRLGMALTNVREIIKKVKLLEELRLGKKKLQLESVDLMEVFTQLVSLLDSRLSDKNITLKIDHLLSPSQRIQADRTLLLNAVLGNILSNAIKFSPRNRFIDVTIYHENEQFVGIQIRDYGIGIPADLLTKIFEFTTETNRPGTENESGTGLGLPLAKACTLMMGGEIEVESYKYQEGVSGPGTSVNLKLRKI